MKTLVVVLFLSIPIVAIGSFWCGQQWVRGSGKAMAEEQARWIARTWKERASVDENCRAAEEAMTGDRRATILREQWQAGSGDDIALGPIVFGKRLCIRRDTMMYWRSAR